MAGEDQYFCVWTSEVIGLDLEPMSSKQMHFLEC